VALAAAVSTGHTAALDQSIRLAVYAHSSPALTAAFRFLTLFGETGVLIGLSVAATAVLAALRWKQAALWFAVSMLGAYALDMALKNSFHRPRPPSPSSRRLCRTPSASPAARAVLGVLVRHAGPADCTPPAAPRARIALWSGAGLLAFAIGCSRIYLGVHYPTDVLAGFAAGVVWLGALAVFLREC